MRRLLYCLVVLALSLRATLFSEEENHASEAKLMHQPSCVLAQAAPSTFVNNTVNVIDGNFYFSTLHLKVPGHVPLDLIQSYNNQSTYNPWFGVGMALNHSFVMQGSSNAGKSNSDFQALMAELPHGSIVRCVADPKKKGTTHYY